MSTQELETIFDSKLEKEIRKELTEEALGHAIEIFARDASVTPTE